MPINNFLLPGAKFIPAYEVANSCRFDASSSAYMHKTPGSTGVEEKFTFSFWIKFNSAHSANQCVLFIEGDNGADDYVEIAFKPQLDIQFNNGTYSNYVTNRKFRDPSAWYHIVIAVDTTQSTAGNRLKLYVNGTQETSWATETVITQNDVLQANTSGKKMWLNAHYNGPKNFIDGYLAEVVWIDGTQYAASDFGEFDSDSPTIWKPKDVSGLTFGTNGFYLDFEDSSNLGNDANGGTDLTEVNLAAVDQASDSPTNNFATLNPLATTDSIGNDITFSEGNCKITNTSDGGWHPAVGNIGATSGKWYCEFKVATIGGASKYGIIDVDQYIERVNFADSTRAYSYEYNSGDAYNGGNYDSDYGDSFTTNDIISVAMDLDNMKLYFAKNGTWQDSGDPESGSTGTGTHAYFGGGSATQRAAGVDTYAFAANIHNNSVTEANFGGCPAFTISSGNADANGYGNFEYSVPSGYYSLCTKNLAEYGG